MVESTDLWVAVLGIVLTAAGSFYALRLTLRRDKVAKDVGIEAVQSGSIQTAIDGLRSLVTSLQEDNRELRTEQRELEKRIADEADACRKELQALSERIAALTR